MKVVCKNNAKHTYFDEDEYEFQIHLNILSSDKWGMKGENFLIINKTDTLNLVVNVGRVKMSIIILDIRI